MSCCGNTVLLQTIIYHQNYTIMKQTMPIDGKFQLVELPYQTKDLEPAVSANTLSFHYGKHLQTYVNNLNDLLPGSKYEGKSLEYIVCNSDGGIFNNAGQIINHNLYFTQFAVPKSGDNMPVGQLAKAIDRQFGSLETFYKEFEKKGATLFGSGWVWLSANSEGKLEITQEANANNPIQRGNVPLLTFDVWEHAYYLDYQNRRPAYLANLWSIVNWEVIEKRYSAL